MNLKEFPNSITVKAIGGSNIVSKKAVCGTVSPRFASIIILEKSMRFNKLTMLTISFSCERFDFSGWNPPGRIV